MSCSITAWLKGLRAWKGVRTLRFGTSFYSVTYSPACCQHCADCCVPRVLGVGGAGSGLSWGLRAPVSCLRCQQAGAPAAGLSRGL